MKNADKPINPALADFDEKEVPRIVSEYTASRGGYKETSLGLTKREYFAGLAMQGILVNNDELLLAESDEGIAKMSIKFADELLKQLEKK